MNGLLPLTMTKWPEGGMEVNATTADSPVIATHRR